MATSWLPPDEQNNPNWSPTGGYTGPGATVLPPVGEGGNTPWTASAAGQIPQSTPGTPGYGGGSSAPASGSSANSYYNPALLSAAQQAAYQAYLSAQLQLQRDQFNFTSQLQREQFAQQKAVEAFNQTLQTANLTGYTPPTDYVDRAQAMWAQMTPEQKADGGTAAWRNLVPGLSSDEAARVAADVKNVWAQTNQKPTDDQVRGFINAESGGRITSGTNTPTLAREQYETNSALSYLNLLNSQRGPTNAFAYLRTLRDTPQSITDIVNRAVQRMGVPGIAAAAGAGVGTQQAQPVAQGPAPASGFAGGEIGPGSMNYQRLASGDPTQPAALPLGSQINAHDWNLASPYLRKLTLAGYEADGQSPDVVLDDYQKSLPKYGASVGARYSQGY